VSSFKISDSINKIIKSIDVSDSFKIKRIESSFKFDDPVSSFKLKSFYRNNDVVFFSGSASSVSRFESFLDSRSKPDLITKTLVLNSVKPSDFVSSASDLFPDVSFKAFDSNNIVAFKCVSSVCDSVVSFINSVDLMPQQIYLELYFLQAGSDFKKEFGFSLFSNNANISYDSSVSSTGATSLSGSSFLINYDTASSIFRFLNSDSTSHIVSSPRVIVSSGKKTILSSGQEVPFNTGSYRASSDGLTSQPFSTVQRKDVGLKIEATPFYFNDGNINFNLSVELSSIIPKSRDSVGAVDLVTSKKSFITEFSVKNDSWIVLAGLDENSLNDSSNSLPFFSWLGFDSTSLSDKTFLIIANIKKI
jgi:type II secretory pathway component GspD/PulD (secretin)